MQVKIQPCLRMGTFLLLFLFTLTSSAEEAHADIIIKSVNLTIQPRNEVQRGTNVSLTCLAEVSYSAMSQPSHKYIFYKDYQPLHTKETSNTELPYFISDARVGHSGKYKCAVVNGKQKKESSVKDLMVKGLQTPVLSVDKSVMREGDVITANCMAEGETGSLTFFFRDGDEELYSESTNNHQVQQKLSLSKGTSNLFCFYFISLGGTMAQSNKSEVIKVNIQELKIKPSITVKPSTNVIEGDTINFRCNVDMIQQKNSELRISLVHGRTTLSFNMTHKNYTMSAKANDSGEFECISSMGNVHKSASVSITVKELFSKPVLSIIPSSVFERERFHINCHVKSFASERIQQDDIKYSIFKDNTLIISNDRYSDTAGRATNGKYMCSAEAKGIIKKSLAELFEAKVLVSKPEITVDGPVIVGKPFWIVCHSENGSLPIFYTLKRKHFNGNWTDAYIHNNKSRFLAMISTPADISSYLCEAKNNGPASAKMSERLYAPVIVPVGKPLLTVIPVPGNTEEGQDLTLICGIPKGSPPISFTFYRSTHTQLHNTTVQSNSSSYVLTAVTRQDSGSYYCRALNSAEEASMSDPITVEVSLATWKKALIAAFCMLLVAPLILVFAMRYKAKRGKKEMAAELSVKPASPKSDESLTLSLTHDYPHTVGVNEKENVWSKGPPNVNQDSEGSPFEGDIEYTEVVHPQPVDPARRAPEHMNHRSMVEYAELNHDLPEPVE
ncbi:platelet endothelial cell adhesion molecule isoform X3 [Myxocyprinus asiaticus]|uniref:platelet endothelial cell adhesion molecule isoform X3 n=1 Tax=Myxocyprinus asiaticus TaxID=70543 RepID=UPI002222184D|nr:platelet endothelial cell adhesion molecule isoform X3 [Myxocyprinus asiaticus]